MKTTARSISSAVIGLGLAAFTVTSFILTGLSTPATAVGVAFLAVYAICEIALLEKAPPPLPRRTGPRRFPAARVAARKTVRVPALVEFSPSISSRRAA